MGESSRDPEGSFSYRELVMPRKRKVTKREESNSEVRRCAVCSIPLGQPAGDGERWCINCLNAIAPFLTASLYKAGKLGEAEATLTHLLEQSRNPIWQYHLGLVQAEAGKLDASIELLMGLVDSNYEHSELPGTLSSLLATRASLRLKDKDYEAAVDDLTLAAVLDQHNQAILRSLSLAKGMGAFLHIDKEIGNDELAGMMKTLQEMQLRQPDNYSITHNLAILSYRLASEAEEEARGEIADHAWRNTIAYWSLLLYADDFWQEWTEWENSLMQSSVSKEDVRNLRISKDDIKKLDLIISDGIKESGVSDDDMSQFRVSDDDIKGLRQAIRKRLQGDFITYRTQYYEINDTNAAKRHQKYEALFRLEMRTAKAMKGVIDLLRRKGMPVAISVPCGSLMLKTLNLLSLAHELITQAQNAHLPTSEIDELEKCLSART